MHEKKHLALKQRFCTHKKSKNMKKYLIIGLLAMMGLGMMSCSGSSCDCQHEPVIPCQFNEKTIDLVAKTTD